MAKDTKKFVDKINEGAGLKRPKNVDEAIGFARKYTKDYSVLDEAQQLKVKGSRDPKWFVKMKTLNTKGGKRSQFVWAEVEGNRLNFKKTKTNNFIKSYLTGKPATMKEIGYKPPVEKVDDVAKATTKAVKKPGKLVGGLKKTAKAPGKLFMKLPPKGKAIVAGGGALVGILKLRKIGKKQKEARNG